MNSKTRFYKKLLVVTLTSASAAASFGAQANGPYYGAPPQNSYWQAPDWSGYGRPPAPPAYQQQPAYAPPAYNNPNPPQYAPRPVPQQNPYGGGYPPPPGPYGYYGPDNGASAFYTPGYNRYRKGRGGWNRNKFWGRSGPSKWMHPNKDNLEQGWDDMINAPSRMGKMPGGWYAPEVTMPNPIDMGDQVQDNMKDLPEQIKDMNVGNEVE
ncbi:MAG TPA: hypothetical protein ENJ11_04090 [Gammaproteobacteria bacterium]|nr:hypothetical protein [Gammaproteobacteria bacterium]